MSADAMRLGGPLARDGMSLAPLAEAHRDGLRTACAEDAAIWAIYSVSYAPDRFDESFDALQAHAGRLAFAIVQDGAVAGMTAYLGVDVDRGVLEIGNTYIVPGLRGTGFNGQLKRLMIDHAIACGFRRIEFRIDARNARSMAAVEKIGALREGVLRRERVTWTGHVRDTALYAVLSEEWH